MENFTALRLIIKLNQSGGVFSRHKMKDFRYEGRADVEATILNLAGELIIWEHFANRVRDENRY